MSVSGDTCISNNLQDFPNIHCNKTLKYEKRWIPRILDQGGKIQLCICSNLLVMSTLSRSFEFKV